MFQSTHPRGVRLRICSRGDYPAEVSINAPAWGATVLAANTHWWQRVSIHAPAWGATQAWVYIRQGKRFQSTHPRGVRPRQFFFSLPIKQFQSTHPRGVRRENLGKSCNLSISFNPRTRVGCDSIACTISGYGPGFNPRTRVGCDLGTTKRHGHCGKFQSTHPRGVRSIVTERR